MDELTKREHLLDTPQSEDAYRSIRSYVIEVQRQVYLAFPNVNALRSELSWTHYRSLMKVNDAKVRAFYMEECAKAGWSSWISQSTSTSMSRIWNRP